MKKAMNLRRLPGDEIDWKMVFLPSPGDLIIFTHWDQGDEIFDVKVGIYDRFGIPIKVETKPSGVKPFTVKSFVPESGLHFIKLTATTGRSIWRSRTFWKKPILEKGNKRSRKWFTLKKEPVHLHN